MRPIRFILASQSPRRRDLLESAGYAIHCHNPEVDELIGGMTPHELAVFNAKSKALDVAVRFPEDIVLGADTVVVFEERIFGKPTDRNHAIQMLREMSGAIHEVITGVCIMKFEGMRVCEFEERSRVKFRALTDAAIEEYLDSINPLDKAGAYAAQEDNGRIIECIEGSLTNVIGLPMERVVDALERYFGEIVKRN